MHFISVALTDGQLSELQKYADEVDDLDVKGLIERIVETALEDIDLMATVASEDY